ncbi:MAG: hypothetical protein OXR71_09370 [Gemmatimonadota bacterium]|nr:hypothetical protein [Gemmatimonadota bacterium]
MDLIRESSLFQHLIQQSREEGFEQGIGQGREEGAEQEALGNTGPFGYNWDVVIFE